MASKLLGVLIIARNGDRSEFLQDPYSYAPSFTESTALGAVRIITCTSSKSHADAPR